MTISYSDLDNILKEVYKNELSLKDILLEYIDDSEEKEKN